MIIGQKTTNPGEMRTQVTLEPRTVAQDAGGFMVPGQGTTVLWWCKWTNAFGSEVWQAEALHALKPATLRGRYLAAVDETWTVRKGSERYEIVGGIDNIEERGEYMEFKVQMVKDG